MIGLLSNRITLKKFDKIPNGRGGTISREREIGERWAAVLPMTYSEQARYKQDDKQIDTRILMRHDPELSTDCIVYFKDRRFIVEQVIDRLRHSEYTELIARGEKI